MRLQTKLFVVAVLFALFSVGHFSVKAQGIDAVRAADTSVALDQFGKITLETYQDKGGTIYLLPIDQDGPKQAAALDAYFSNLIDQQMLAQANKLPIVVDRETREVTHKSGNNTGYNGSAKSYTSTSGYRDRGFFVVKINIGGYNSGSWTGSSTPTHIILNEQVCFSGAAVTVSWPPSLSGSGSCGSYSSSPWTGRKSVSTSYSNAQAQSYVGLFSAKQTDQPVVRISSHDYRPTSTVNLSWGL